MAKDYEHKPNLLELYTISLKIMGIFLYKRHETPEWKLFEVFYKYPNGDNMLWLSFEDEYNDVAFFTIQVLDKLLLCNSKLWTLILFEWNFNRKNSQSEYIL